MAKVSEKERNCGEQPNSMPGLIRERSTEA